MKHFLRFSLLILFYFITVVSIAQDNEQAKIDSLQSFIAKAPKDTSKVQALCLLTDIVRVRDLNKAIGYGEKAFALATDIKYNKGIARAKHLQGLMEYAKGNFESSKKKYLESLKTYQEIGDKSGIAKLLYNLGVVAVFTGDYADANDKFFQSLRMYESIGDKKGPADCYGAIANVYGRQGNSKKELEYQLKSLKIKQDIGDKVGLTATLINLGNVYGRQQVYDTALIYYQRGLKMAEEMHHQKFILNALGNIGTVYAQQGKRKEGLPYLIKCFDMAEIIGDKQAMATTLNTISGIYSEDGDNVSANRYAEQALKISSGIGNKLEMKVAYQNLSSNFARMGDYKNAYEAHKEFSYLNDSILNEANSKQINEVQAKYDSDKKEQEIELLSKDKEIQTANLKQQKIILIFVICGLFLVIVFAGFVYRQFKEKQKANTALQSAYHQIEEKNKDITDSINYARRIQTAILPSMENIQKHLKESFVLYQPKDIVSGDFYWYAEKNNKLILAVADCTGHGVPGAFMSMIGNDFLTQTVIEKGITQPNLILTQLHDGVKNALKQDTDAAETKDGMDICLIAIDKNDLTHVEYAGALRPLWVVKKANAELVEYKADKHSIGGSYSSEQRDFTNHVLKLEKGDSLYMSSDGYADQFGGAQGKKFMTKNMKELIVAMQSKSMSQQGTELHEALVGWKQGRQQIDDILVVGVKL